MAMEPGGSTTPTTAVIKDRMDAAMTAIRAAEAIFLAEFSRYIQAGGCKEDGARNPSDWAGYAYGLTAARAQQKGYCEYHHVERYDGTNTVHRYGCRLCLTHHWLVHEGGWTLKGDRISGFQFFKPDGTLFTPGEPPPQPATDGAHPAQRLQTILRHLLDQTRQDIHDEGRPDH